jgi:hypothetical protein
MRAARTTSPLHVQDLTFQNDPSPKHHEELTVNFGQSWG